MPRVERLVLHRRRHHVQRVLLSCGRVAAAAVFEDETEDAWHVRVARSVSVLAPQRPASGTSGGTGSCAARAIWCAATPEADPSGRGGVQGAAPPRPSPSTARSTAARR